MEPTRTKALDSTWLGIGSAFAVLGLAISLLQVTGVLAHEERDQAVRIDDPAVAVLDVGSDGGTVEVVGAAVDHVQIDAHLSDGLIATRFTHQVVADRLQVRVRCVAVIANQWCGANLRIVVPRDLEVKVRAGDDGVTVRGLAGRVDAESSGGSVEAEALAGPTRLHSDDGSVRASRLRTENVQADSGNGSVHLEFAVAPRSVIAHADNGDVDVALPRGDEAYAVDVRGEGPEALVRTDPASDRRIVAGSSNGGVTVRYVE